MTTTTLLTRAADTIAREAEELRALCAGERSDWACDDCAGFCTAREIHTNDMALVRELRAEAERLRAAPKS